VGSNYIRNLVYKSRTQRSDLFLFKNYSILATFLGGGGGVKKIGYRCYARCTLQKVCQQKYGGGGLDSRPRPLVWEKIEKLLHENILIF
jgi:hypothetical protein